MKKALRNERGNMTLLTIGTLFFTGLLLVIVVDIGKIFITNQQANIAAEQASLSASSVVYEDVSQHIINTYIYINDNDEEIRLIDEYRDAVQRAGTTLSDSEKSRWAIDYVLLENMGKDAELRQRVSQTVTASIPRIHQTVGQIITENHGEQNETSVTTFNDDYRIMVETAVEWESTFFPDVLESRTELVEQRAVGMEISFLAGLTWHNETASIP